MSFTNAVTSSTVEGNKRIVYGTVTQTTGSDVGGAVITGLTNIDYIGFTCTSSAAINVPVATISGGTATIVTDAFTNWVWKAEGV